MRHLLGRKRSGEQGPTPPWLPIHASLIPFVCGSLAGVSSWALIYPLDVVKTKIQQRALAGAPSRTVRETFHRLIRGKMTTLTSKKNHLLIRALQVLIPQIQGLCSLGLQGFIVALV